MEGRTRKLCLYQVGVNASSRAILERLVRADTASAFNISVGDVKVTGVTQVRLPAGSTESRCSSVIVCLNITQ